MNDYSQALEPGKSDLSRENKKNILLLFSQFIAE